MSNESPRIAFLKALTLDAQTAIHGHQIAISAFPFRVGRESRGPDVGWTKERRTSNSAPNNELYLWEQHKEIHVSREHFMIEREGDKFTLVDRQSALGTWVEGHLVGGNRRGGKVRLNDNDVLIIGTHLSGFIFKFCIDSSDH